MIIDCISDMHGHFPRLEGGEILIVAGDSLGEQTPEEALRFLLWMHAQPYDFRVFIGGNHDALLEGESPFPREETCIPGQNVYLMDSGCKILDVSMWGSPWTLTFPGMNPKCKAFTVNTEQEMAEKLQNIPSNIDFLITHAAPKRILDQVNGHNDGSKALHDDLCRVKPKYHIFGHNHENGGMSYTLHHRDDAELTICSNVSVLDERYQMANKPTRIIYGIS